MTIAPERLEGIAAVGANTPSDWCDAFDKHIESIPIGTRFSVYDVLLVVGRPQGVHPSAIGARMRAVSTQGLVTKVGHARRESHGDDVTLWERCGGS